MDKNNSFPDDLPEGNTAILIFVLEGFDFEIVHCDFGIVCIRTI